MKVLVIASQKGGAGKTTISGHIAVQAEAAGYGSVALIDTDPQQGLTGWWKVRPTDTIPMVKVLAGGLVATLGRLRDAGVSLVVIDTPPAITDSILATLAVADIVVVPVKPSPHDLRAVGATVDLVESLNKPMVFVVNQATVRAKITSEAVMALSQHGTVAPVVIHQRIDFAASMSGGLTVTEVDRKSNSAAEIGLLWSYLKTRMEKDARVKAPRAKS